MNEVTLYITRDDGLIQFTPKVLKNGKKVIYYDFIDGVSEYGAYKNPRYCFRFSRGRCYDFNELIKGNT